MWWLCDFARSELRNITNDQSDVHAKVQGQRSKVKVTEVKIQLYRFRTVTPVWIHIWWWNDAYSLMLHRRGALLFFKVIRQISRSQGGWVGLWGFLWWAPSAKRKDLHGVSSGWSSVWHRSNTGLSSTQYEQIPIILGVWPFWLTPFFFRSISFWRAYG